MPHWCVVFLSNRNPVNLKGRICGFVAPLHMLPCEARYQAVGGLDTTHLESVHNVHVKLRRFSCHFTLTLIRVNGWHVTHFPSAEEWWMYSWLLREKMGNRQPCGCWRIGRCAQLPLCLQLNVLSVWLWLSPRKKSGSPGNNPGIVLITSRLEPNWIILLTGCLLKDFSTMSNAYCVGKTLTAVPPLWICCDWMDFFFFSINHISSIVMDCFSSADHLVIRGVTGLTRLWIKSTRK